jgi:hypothetical protein
MATQILERRIRGDFDLEMLADRCGTIQNMSSCKLVRVSKKTDEPEGKFNLALFEKVPLTQVAPMPTLIEVTNPDAIPEIVAEQSAQGRKVLFDSTIFVENKDVRAMGFR